MRKILYLEKRGCDFLNNDYDVKVLSDVGNYRVGIYDYFIHGKNGRNYILNFGGYDKKDMERYDKNGKELKLPKTKVIQKNALHIDTQYEDENGIYRDLELEENLRNRSYAYTLADILKCVNEISEEQYTEIQFIS
ncbi:hypothetical protein [Sellimonas intestinalis]|uniref:hypothetical protein n=1 Tax=Sellimonas intestinalis TaxID=1653434 RepID=UPI003991D9BD